MYSTYLCINMCCINFIYCSYSNMWLKFANYWVEDIFHKRGILGFEVWHIFISWSSVKITVSVRYKKQLFFYIALLVTLQISKSSSVHYKLVENVPNIVVSLLPTSAIRHNRPFSCKRWANTLSLYNYKISIKKDKCIKKVIQSY